jgi:hypothetical protein
MHSHLRSDPISLVCPQVARPPSRQHHSSSSRRILGSAQARAEAFLSTCTTFWSPPRRGDVTTIHDVVGALHGRSSARLRRPRVQQHQALWRRQQARPGRRRCKRGSTTFSAARRASSRRPRTGRAPPRAAAAAPRAQRGGGSEGGRFSLGVRASVGGWFARPCSQLPALDERTDYSKRRRRRRRRAARRCKEARRRCSSRRW